MVAVALKTTEELAGVFVEPGQSNWITTGINNHHWWFVILLTLLASIIALITLKPTTSVKARLKQRDLNIYIEVGDLFVPNKTLVIGTNTSFDTSFENNLINPTSLQGQFTKRFYGDTVQYLDADLNKSLDGVNSTSLKRQEKRVGKLEQYPIGTVAKIAPKNQEAYLVAMARINTHGVASTTIEDIRTALSALWIHISEKGGGLPSLRVPILGTGFGKLTETREQVVREILRSFVAACASDRFCDEFTIVISVKDFIEHQIDLNELGDFLKYLTSYTEMRSASDTGSGVGVAA